MTNDHAHALVAHIDTLRKSAQRQINVEFEGFAPDFDLPQAAASDAIIAEINASGTHAYSCGRLITKAKLIEIREGFNGRVKGFMAANPGKQVPSAKVIEWQNDVGMSIADIKMFVEIFGL